MDGADLYEDLPAAPPLLAPPHLPVHQLPPQLRYKEGDLLPPPRAGVLPPTPALHLYSPEPRPETPSDHLYHHISSGGWGPSRIIGHYIRYAFVAVVLSSLACYLQNNV